MGGRGGSSDMSETQRDRHWRDRNESRRILEGHQRNTDNAIDDDSITTAQLKPIARTELNAVNARIEKLENSGNDYFHELDRLRDRRSVLEGIQSW